MNFGVLNYKNLFLLFMWKTYDFFNFSFGSLNYTSLYC